jgi:hypothetical protein
MLEDSGFVDIAMSEPFDVFEGASGETNARLFEVFGYTFMGRKPA